jgi:hypothetical protein
MTYRTAYRSISLLGATAILAVFGGLHFENASGRALEQIDPGDARVQTNMTLATSGINRDAKTDRSGLSANAAGGRTITFQLPEMPSTTIAVRIWEAAGVLTQQPVASSRPQPAGARKRVIACEGVVSALTDIAKHLDPGRCVT